MRERPRLWPIQSNQPLLCPSDIYSTANPFTKLWATQPDGYSHTEGDGNRERVATGFLFISSLLFCCDYSFETHTQLNRVWPVIHDPVSETVTCPVLRCNCSVDCVPVCSRLNEVAEMVEVEERKTKKESQSINPGTQTDHTFRLNNFSLCSKYENRKQTEIPISRQIT